MNREEGGQGSHILAWTAWCFFSSKSPVKALKINALMQFQNLTVHYGKYYFV